MDIRWALSLGIIMLFIISLNCGCSWSTFSLICSLTHMPSKIAVEPSLAHPPLDSHKFHGGDFSTPSATRKMEFRAKKKKKMPYAVRTKEKNLKYWGVGERVLTISNCISVTIYMSLFILIKFCQGSLRKWWKWTQRDLWTRDHKSHK